MSPPPTDGSCSPSLFLCAFYIDPTDGTPQNMALYYDMVKTNMKEINYLLATMRMVMTIDVVKVSFLLISC